MCREGKDAPKAAKLLAPAVGKVLYTQAEGPRGWKVRRCLSEQCLLCSRWALMPHFTETAVSAYLIPPRGCLECCFAC